MEISKKLFGILPDGREAHLYTLINESGMEVDITNFGGIVTSIRIPDRNKEPGDIVLGFDTLEGYLGDHPYFGAIIGRFGNRIDQGKFTLDGTEYSLFQNDGSSHLHGGKVGYDKVLWTASKEKALDSVSLKLGYISHHLEEGYPGNLMLEVVYTVNDRNELLISYRATTDHVTHVNLANHSYFNLNNCKGDILDHELMIDADSVTELNHNSIPTGKILKVVDGCFDFRESKQIGRDIEEIPPGYDINYVLNDYTGELRRIASLYHEKSGRCIDVLTTEPGVQLYTSNYIEEIPGKEGIVYKKHSAVCLETQHFPDSPNHDTFPSTVLNPGEEYKQLTIYRFTW